MTCRHRAATSGGAFASALFLLLGLAATQAHAETVKTVNGTDIDSTVVDVYVENRLNKPADEATSSEREALINELTDIYLLSTQDSVEALEDDPEIAAQIELQKRGVLAQAAARQFFEQNEVSDDEVREEYEEQLKLAPPLQYKARHILVSTQDGASKIINRLDAGEDFQEIAKESSSDASAEQGGDLGWFSPDQMVKPFSDSVVELEDGAYTKEPVQTQFGWHVILREDSRENQPPPLESVRDALTQNVQQKKFQQHLDSLRAAADD